jgi:asparagine synthase (glutamine-hydrolysing)
MSVQFGKCNFDGKNVGIHEFDEVRDLLAPFGPDGQGQFCKDNFGVHYRALHTTKESSGENQPHVSRAGLVITWDGRLDNRRELIEKFGGEISPDSMDPEIVAAGYERWGADILRELTGDWALSLWNAQDQSLLLAKDFVGTRHLYYFVDKDEVTWCTILDPLVLLRRHPFKLEMQYVAGWLSFFPATHLTPYVGVRAVPPSCFIRFTRGSEKLSKYWDFNPSRQIRYLTDKEYEEHFRSVFKESVRRRLRSNLPIIAELSGGMDSSSIVCMADEIARCETSPGQGIETVSYYDDSEPNCDDRIYFTLMEQKRGQKGCHIKLSAHRAILGSDNCGLFAPVPGVTHDSDDMQRFAALITSTGSRALLSGFGGDEVTGGVPTPVPELADLLVRARLHTLACQLKRWALQERKPWIYLFLEAIQEFLPEGIVASPQSNLPPAWLQHDFAEQHSSALLPDRKKARIFGPLPSFQTNLKILEILRRQLECSAPERPPTCEKRYPYLDRDLLEFLFFIPREQLVRPGQRRSLMRRALVGIVPEEILWRRRKAFVVRGPMSEIANRWTDVLDFSQNLLTSALGIIDKARFLKTLDSVRVGRQVAMVPLLRAFAMEQWLRNPQVLKCLDLPDTAGMALFSSGSHELWQRHRCPGIDLS